MATLPPKQVRDWVARTRAKQGLPPTITDPATLAELAALVVETMAPQGKAGDRDAA
jgi:hypothetical protein